MKSTYTLKKEQWEQLVHFSEKLKDQSEAESKTEADVASQTETGSHRCSLSHIHDAFILKEANMTVTWSYMNPAVFDQHTHTHSDECVLEAGGSLCMLAQLDVSSSGVGIV